MEALGRYCLHDVPEDLRGVVACLWTLDPPAGARWAEEVWPDLGADLIIAARSSYLRGEEQIRGAVLDGVGLTARRFGHGAADRLAGARLRPGALVAWPSLARAAARDTAVALGEPALVEAVGRSPSPEGRVAALVAWLRRHRSGRRWAGIGPALSILGAGGTVGGAADRLGVSRRTLERHFLVGVGLRPKEAQRLLRFRQAAGALDLHFPRLGPEAVTTFGYADQAHFSRECRAMTGAPPRRWWCRISSSPLPPERFPSPG